MLEPVDEQRARCGDFRNWLRKLTQIHIDIDAPARRIESDDSDWVFRLRKVCLHTLAIIECEVSTDGIHIMVTELRAAYEQMDVIWKCLPDAFRFEKDGSWWSVEAGNRLAVYNHPTKASLALPLAEGGFEDAEAPESYLRLAVWLGRLGCGYGLALGYLAQLFSVEDNIHARLDSVLSKDNPAI